MLIYPNINRVAFHIGSLPVYWYGMMYLLGFSVALGLGNLRIKNIAFHSPVNSDQFSDLIFYCALGVILGGRIGYMLFYAGSALRENPFLLFKIWEGGMSFHGGLIGVIIAVILYSRKIKENFFVLADFLAPLVPIGLGAGRIGNFINGELWGRMVGFPVPWAMIYPHVDQRPRHPSQIYEFLLEGVLLFVILWFFSSKPRPKGVITGLFLCLYGSFRFFSECFREPDSQIGFIAFHWLTLGQLLCLPMIIIGLLCLIIAYQRKMT